MLPLPPEKNPSATNISTLQTPPFGSQIYDLSLCEAPNLLYPLLEAMGTF